MLLPRHEKIAVMAVAWWKWSGYERLATQALQYTYEGGFLAGVNTLGGSSSSSDEGFVAGEGVNVSGCSSSPSAEVASACKGMSIWRSSETVIRESSTFGLEIACLCDSLSTHNHPDKTIRDATVRHRHLITKPSEAYSEACHHVFQSRGRAETRVLFSKLNHIHGFPSLPW